MHYIISALIRYEDLGMCKVLYMNIYKNLNYLKPLIRISMFNLSTTFVPQTPTKEHPESQRIHHA